jgi:hypothetical protein
MLGSGTVIVHEKESRIFTVLPDRWLHVKYYVINR